MALGHGRVLAYFTEAYKKNQLGHAYCLVGAPGIGKRTVAREVAALVLGIVPEKLETHPDFYYRARAVDEKTGRVKQQFSVAQARELRQKLERQSWVGGYQVVILDEAELLTTEAANALLKILEEPPEKSLFFLLTTDDAALLPTVRSRAQVLFLQRLPDRELALALFERGFGEVAIAKVLPLAVGIPGKALALLMDGEALGDLEAEHERWKALQQEPFFSQVKIVESLLAEEEGGERAQERLHQLFNCWQLWWRTELLATKDRPEKIVSIIDTLEDGKELLAKNVNPRLVVENIVMHF